MNNLEIVMKGFFQVKPYERNARNNEQTVVALMKAIERFGFNQPIVIDKEGVIVKGHARYEAARRLGLVEIPCIVSQNSDEVNRADRIYDNKISELAHWDPGSLNTELRDIGGIMDEILGSSCAAPEYHIEKIDVGVTEGAMGRAEVKRVQESDAGKQFVKAVCPDCGEELFFERKQLERLI
jgi:ParB-like chromosome segregation protein Spo0J